MPGKFIDAGHGEYLWRRFRVAPVIVGKNNRERRFGALFFYKNGDTQRPKTILNGSFAAFIEKTTGCINGNPPVRLCIKLVVIGSSADERSTYIAGICDSAREWQR